MNWWKNLPFFLIWGPMLLSGVTAVLRPRRALYMAMLVPMAEVV